MIYVSSSCVRAPTIAEAVRQLVDAGYRNIELSGGTRPYGQLAEDLLSLKDRHGLNYLCHNYFPPPEVDFVLNLASLDDEISSTSVDHVLKAIALSERLGARKFAFHAGFLIDIPLGQIGKKISQQELFDREQATRRFNDNYGIIAAQCPETVELYVENNVVSKANYLGFGRTNLFLLTEFAELKGFPGVKPLLDVAHLKVSTATLGGDFARELEAFGRQTDYIHISDNNGEEDSNQRFGPESHLFRSLQSLDLRGKTITLEVYSGPQDLKESYQAVERLVHG